MNFALINVLVTRAARQSREFVEALEKNGFNPVLFPMIEIIPPDSWDLCDKAIDSLYMYDGLIFTSANGVEFFFRRLAERNIAAQECQNKIICVVGEKTKAVCEKHGLSVTLMPDKFTSNDLFRALQQQDIRDRVFLHPRGNLGKEQLSGNLKILGAKVDPVVVYNTVQPKKADIQEIKTKILAGEINVLTFTSPSTVKNFAAMFSPYEFKKIADDALVVVIGPVTKEASTVTGFRHVHLATTSTIESMITMLVQLFNVESAGNPK